MADGMYTTHPEVEPGADLPTIPCAHCGRALWLDEEPSWLERMAPEGIPHFRRCLECSAKRLFGSASTQALLDVVHPGLREYWGEEPDVMLYQVMAELLRRTRVGRGD
jgi:hypothetical protein